MLHREARALAIRRIEESARTEEDFREVIKWWDRLDANRERKERSHEVGRSGIPIEWGAEKMYLSDKSSYDMVLRRLMLAGDFLDYIFDHPETIHKLVTDAVNVGLAAMHNAPEQELKESVLCFVKNTVSSAL